MPLAVMDREDVGDLSGTLRAIANLLDGWVEGAPRGPEHSQVEAVGKQFASIHKELEASGKNGEQLRAHLGPIADHLRAAAEALQKGR